MSFDNHRNFGYSTVATAPSPATSGTSLVVATGDGAKFPAAPFNATVWPAGAQPTTANAEVVRVTAKAGDTLTITRAQEGSSARSIGVGDQIANTITAKVLTDIESLVVGSSGGIGAGTIVYVDPPTGVAATDTAAIQAAHDSLPSEGGIVQLCRGSYAIDPSSPLVFSKAILLRGHGRVPPRAGASQGYSTTAPTMLTFDSATATCISCTATDTFRIRDIGIVNTHSTAPTAGAGIAVTGSLVSGFEIIGVSVVGFYRNIDIQEGSEWLIQRCYIGDFVAAGIRIQNLTNADYGDGEISSNYIYRGPSYLGANHGVECVSASGTRMLGNKFNIDGTPGSDGSIAIYLNTIASAVASDLLIENNSIENYDFGIATSFTPGSGSSVANIIVVGNEILATTACIDFNTSSTGFFKSILISDNVVVGTGSGVILSNVDRVAVGANVYGSGLATALSISSVTNLTQFVTSVFGRGGAVVAANGDYAGVVAAALTGATAATRYVGGTASGAPASGTFLKGDFVITQDGNIYICTTAGTPGTWAQVSGAGGVTSFAKQGSTALTGAVTISPGSGVTMTQSGQNVAIASTASGSGSTDGWLDDTAETWTFASATTFTVTGDQTTKYTPGTRIKLTQATVKYFVVAASSVTAGTTTVTVAAGSDYSIANAAISANYHSYEANPQGFPGWFAFTVPATGWSSTTKHVGRFCVNGRACTIEIVIQGTSNSTAATVTLPIAAVSGGGIDVFCRIEDNTLFSATPGLAEIDNSGGATSTLSFYKDALGTGFTASGTKEVSVVITYEI